MKNKLAIVLVLCLVLVFAMTLVACNKGNGGGSNEPSIPDYVVPTIGAAYGQTLADVALPEGFSWDEPLTTSVGEVGSNIFHVTFTPADTTAFKTITGIEVTINVTKGTPQPATVANLNATYGQTLADVALPTGFSWEEATTTSVGNAGTNVFHVKFTPSDTTHFNEVRNIPVSVIVAKANYDMTGIALNGGSFTYDGTVKSLAISGTLPQGVEVTYENNGKTDAGQYPVVAHFTGDANHNAIQDMTATLTILKSDIQGLSFVDKTVVYNGQVQSIAVTGTVPQGVEVTYENNGKTNAGEYEVTAHFNGGTNYNNLPDLFATLTIARASVLDITFPDADVTYDGQVHAYEVTGTLPQGVTVEYHIKYYNTSTYEWDVVDQMVNAGDYEITAVFTVNDNYLPKSNMNADFTIYRAVPDISVFTDELYVIDNESENNKFGYGANLIIGVDPQKINGDWPVPCTGYNILYGDYYKLVGDVLDGGVDYNYEPVEDVAFNVMGWDSSLHTTEKTYNELTYLSTLYVEEQNITLRLVNPSGVTTLAALKEDADEDSLFVYVYEGHVTNDESFYGDNKLVPIAVYTVWDRDLFFSVEKTTWYWIDNAGDPQITNSETIYLINIDENTLQMSFYETGEIEYLYVNEAMNYTLSFNKIGDSAPYAYLLFEFEGTYTWETLPQFGAIVGEWDDEDTHIYEYYYNNYYTIGENNYLSIITGEQQYVYGFWEDNGFMGVDGENFIVLSFNVLFNDYNGLWAYVFDEEVDLDIDLSRYEPIIYRMSWEIVSAGTIGCEFGHFLIQTDDSLNIDYSDAYFVYEYMSSPSETGTLYFYEHYIYSAFPFTTENKVLTAEYYYDEDSNIMRLWYADGNFAFDVSSYNLGTLTMRVGEIVGWTEFGHNVYAGKNMYGVLSKDGNQRKVFYYLAESYEDIFNGTVEPLLSDTSYLSWRIKDGIIALSSYGQEGIYYQVDNKKMLINYVGENVYSYVYYEYVSEQDHTVVGGERFDFNIILGNKVMVCYYTEGDRDINNNLIWIYTSDDPIQWEYSELGDFIVTYTYEGSWAPYRNFYFVEEDGVRTLERVQYDMCVCYYGYYYEDKGSYNIETHQWDPVYTTNVVMLAVAGEYHDEAAFIYTFVGKLAEKDIITFAELMTLNPGDAAAMEAAGCIGVLNPNGCGWEYDSSDYTYVDVTIYNDKDDDTDDEYRGFYCKGTDLSTIPFGYEVAYLLKDILDEAPYAFFRYPTDETKNAEGYVAADWEAADLSHVWYEASFGTNGYYWTTVEKEGKTYIVDIQSGYPVYVALIEGNTIDWRYDPSVVVYTKEIDPDDTPGNGDEYTLLFADINGMANVTGTIDEIGLSKADIENAFENGSIMWDGAWAQEGNYIRFMSRNYLHSLVDSHTVIGPFDLIVFELDSEHEGEIIPSNYKGTVRTVVQQGGYTYAFGTFFDQVFVIKYDTLYTLEQAIAEFNTGTPVAERMLPGNLYWMEDMGIFELVYNAEDEQWVIQQVSFDIVWFVREDASVFVEYGNTKLVFNLPDDAQYANIYENGTIEDFDTVPYYTYYGTWYVDLNNADRIINIDDDAYPLLVVDREAGELEWVLMI